MGDPDISCVVTFHAEGNLAASTLASIRRCTDAAGRDGLTCEVVAVLDRASPETRASVACSPDIRVIETDAGDPATARNAGVSAARGTFVSTLDGDDYYGENWLAAARSRADRSPGTILHPEYVVRFGEEETFLRQVGMDEDAFSPGMFIMHNPWSLWSFAETVLFRRFPFSPVDGGREGFGFEDWHWHCETLAAGIRHEIVPGTCGFYRRRSSGVFSREHGSKKVIRRSALFDILSPGGIP